MIDAIGEKRCPKCGEVKPLTEFAKSQQRYRSHCKRCCCDYAKRYQKQGPQGRAIKEILPPPADKTCTKCGKTKPLSDFSIQKSGARKGRISAACKRCNEERNLLWKKAHPEKVALIQKQKRERARQKSNRPRRLPSNKIRYRIAITQDQYNELLEKQGGVCAICGKVETVKTRNGKIRSLAVDHNHTTGEIRGLLCFRCNTRLAVLEDDKTAIAQAYLSQAM